MIYQREIIQKAEEWKVTPSTVDKDYVLGHFLRCFFSFQNNRELFVFKGGTCLRKCYFPNYRFSEDLDFTLLEESSIVDEDWIQQIVQACGRESGIQFHLIGFEEKYFKDDKKGYQCKVAFWGANHNQNIPPPPVERWHTKIELDFSFDEELLFPINHLSLIHPYSDNELFKGFSTPVYSLEEVLVEKVRAFFQRSYKAPRDFYDVWYLMNHNDFNEWNKIREALLVKCGLKNITVNRALFDDIKIYESVEKSWLRSLVHHLSAENLVKFEEVWSYLNLHLFKSIYP